MGLLRWQVLQVLLRLLLILHIYDMCHSWPTILTPCHPQHALLPMRPHSTPLLLIIILSLLGPAAIPFTSD